MNERKGAKCEHCGDSFIASRASQRFCGVRCRNKSNAKRSGAAHRKRQSELIRQRNRGKVCPVCGEVFDAKRADTKYCSRQCYIKANTIKRRTDPERRRRTAAYKRRPRQRVDRAMCVAMNKALRQHKAGRSWEALAGYSLDALIAHLESLFQPGMTWDNYGEWHIDHITPKSWFTYTSEADASFVECWSLSNLQPMWASDNLRKSNRYAA